MDIPILFDEFSVYYQIFYTVNLNIPTSQVLMKLNEDELNSEELKQMVYWKPETMGQIIFNYWD
ncbi:hypothetical protein [Niallia nealsonii]|uniref:hypothetical protein n=1 Tax=Niallia nealsonii TaxID=115979 RepID=UPI001F3A8CB6|nr:hypothetical protein [Niallia nealsonii]